MTRLDECLSQEDINALLLAGAFGDDESEGVQSMKDWEEAIRDTDATKQRPAQDILTAGELRKLPNLDKLRKAYQASWVRHPYEWPASSGHIDEVDGRFLALAFNLMHHLVAGLPSPVRPAPLSRPKAFHEGGRP